jgi:hypothetical protein
LTKTALPDYSRSLITSTNGKTSVVRIIHLALLCVVPPIPFIFHYGNAKIGTRTAEMHDVVHVCCHLLVTEPGLAPTFIDLRADWLGLLLFDRVERNRKSGLTLMSFLIPHEALSTWAVLAPVTDVILPEAIRPTRVIDTDLIDLIDHFLATLLPMAETLAKRIKDYRMTDPNNAIEYVQALRDLLLLGSAPLAEHLSKVGLLFEALGRPSTPYPPALNMLMGVIARFNIHLTQFTFDRAIVPRGAGPFAPMLDFFLQLLPIYSAFPNPSTTFLDAFYTELAFARSDALGVHSEVILRYAETLTASSSYLTDKIKANLGRFATSNFCSVLRVCKARNLRAPVLRYLKTAVSPHGNAESSRDEAIALALEIDAAQVLESAVANDLRLVAKLPGVSEENRTNLEARAATRNTWGGTTWVTHGL